MNKIQKLKERANYFYQNNRLADARSLYKDICKDLPNDLDALMMLGIISGGLNQYSESEACFRKIIAAGNNHYSVWDNLGVSLLFQGKNSEAETCFLRCIKIDPNNPRGQNNLANSLSNQGQIEEAISYYKQALAIEPGYHQALNNLGTAYLGQGNISNAISCYQKAIQLNQSYFEAIRNLAGAYQENGDAVSAEACFRKVLSIQPEDIETNKSLALHYWELGDVDKSVAFVLSTLQLHLESVSVLPRRAVILCLIKLPGIQKLIDCSGPDVEGHFKNLLLSEECSALYDNSILHSILTNIIIGDVSVEFFLTALRRLYLEALFDDASSSIERLFSARAALAVALAHQCFNNEYAYFICDDEFSMLEKLSENMHLINGNDGSFDETTRRMMIIYAMYKPLYELDNISGCNQKVCGQLFSNLFHKQVNEPREERELACEIPSLTDITDKTSLAVAEQYDEAPFPRWLHIARSKPKPYLHALSSIFTNFPPPVFAEKRIKILVAGCGTGSHAIRTASRFSDADILAIDISRNCLAYARRKTDELGINNITYMHADLLELGGIKDRFHIIEATGVLQTLQDPLRGLKVLKSLLCPSGLISVGLYSANARAEITAASLEFKRKGFIDKNKNDIRRLRLEIMQRNESDPLRLLVTHMWDFYTLSECRNLFFLVHEVCHTISDISEMVEQANLKFINFETKGTLPEQRLREVSSGNPDTSDLGLWQSVEEKYPDTFISMYDFWCQGF